MIKCVIIVLQQRNKVYVSLIVITRLDILYAGLRKCVIHLINRVPNRIHGEGGDHDAKQLRVKMRWGVGQEVCCGRNYQFYEFRPRLSHTNNDSTLLVCNPHNAEKPMLP